MIQVIIKKVEQISHKGQTYEHHVVVELPSGDAIGLYDPDMLTNTDAVGHARRVKIGLLIDGESIKETPTDDISKGIEPASTDPQGTKNHIYRGTVVAMNEITESVTEVTLDVGDGTVSFRRNTTTARQLALQDSLEVRAQRSDIWDIDN